MADKSTGESKTAADMPIANDKTAVGTPTIPTIMTNIPTIEELFERPMFLESFIDASKKLSRKTNTLGVVTAYTSLSILQELKEIKELLKEREEKKPTRRK